MKREILREWGGWFVRKIEKQLSYLQVPFLLDDIAGRRCVLGVGC